MYVKLQTRLTLIKHRLREVIVLQKFWEYVWLIRVKIYIGTHVEFKAILWNFLMEKHMYLLIDNADRAKIKHKKTKS